MFPSPEASIPTKFPSSSTATPPLLPGKLLAVVWILPWGYFSISEKDIIFPLLYILFEFLPWSNATIFINPLILFEKNNSLGTSNSLFKVNKAKSAGKLWANGNAFFIFPSLNLIINCLWSSTTCLLVIIKLSLIIVPLAIIIGVLIPTTLSKTLQIFLLLLHFLETE